MNTIKTNDEGSALTPKQISRRRAKWHYTINAIKTKGSGERFQKARINLSSPLGVREFQVCGHVHETAEAARDCAKPQWTELL